MSASHTLHDDLETWLSQHYCWRDQRHLQVLIYMVTALLYSGSVNLSKWSSYLPNRGNFAQSQQRRLSRWLKNPNIDVSKHYGIFLKAALSTWCSPKLYVSIDGSMLWNEYCLLRLAVVHHGRALPIAWQVTKQRSSLVVHKDYCALVETAAQRLPSGVAIILLADRGFVHTQLMSQLQQLGWGYRIRLKRNHWIRRPARSGWYQLESFHLAAGEAMLLREVYLHKASAYGPINVAIALHPNGEFWAIASNQSISRETFVDYGWRFSIEESFLDDKSNGFELERSRIRSAQMLERLCFVLAVATLYLTAQGIAVVEAGNRRQVDVHLTRGNSYLRIGWDWVRRQLVAPISLISQVQFSGRNSTERVVHSTHPEHRFSIHNFVIKYSRRTL